MLWLVVLLWSVMRLAPSQLPSDAPASSAPPSARATDPLNPEDFSAPRALQTLARVLEDVGDHGVGTSGADEVRRRLRRELEAVGAAVEVRTGWACTRSGTRCAHLDNLIARLGSATAARPAVLLASHYDAVPASPGAGDDGVGLAVSLEIARIWAAAGTPWPLVILMDEGEEVGLLGALAFEHDDLPEPHIGLVLNLEARGTEGKVSMFQTTGDAAGWIDRYARHVRHPFANSLSAEVYARMPNDTDLTVFGAAGRAGLNFAMIDGYPRYHTAKDDLAHLDPRSVQHMGGQVLDLLNSLRDEGWPDASMPPRAYLDLADGLFVWWPASWSRALALALFAMSLTSWCSRTWRAGTRPRALLAAGMALARPVIAVAVAAALGWLIVWVVTAWTGHQSPGYAHPLALQLAMGVAAATAVSWLRGTSSAPARDAAAGVTLWNAVGVIVAFSAAGASVVWIVPGLVSVIALLLHPRVLRSSSSLAALLGALPFAMTLVVWVPLVHAVQLAFGPSPPFFVAGLWALTSWTMPVPAGRGRPSSRAVRTLWTAAVVVLTLTATTRPHFSEDAPQPLSLVRVEHHVTDGTTVARLAWGGWGVEASLPDEVREGQTWRALQREGTTDAPLRRWLGGGTWRVRHARHTSTPPPRVEISRRAPDLLEIVVRSRRAATALSLDVEEADIVEVDGHALERPTRQMMVFGAPGHASTFIVKTADPVTFTAADVHFGAHPVDDARVARRPRWTAPRQGGDRHVVSVTSRWRPPMADRDRDSDTP